MAPVYPGADLGRGKTYPTEHPRGLQDLCSHILAREERARFVQALESNHAYHDLGHIVLLPGKFYRGS